MRNRVFKGDNCAVVVLPGKRYTWIDDGGQYAPLDFTWTSEDMKKYSYEEIFMPEEFAL